MIEVQQFAVVAIGGYSWPSRLSVRGSIGAVLDGSLEGAGERHDLDPGIVGSVSVARQWLIGAWFVTGSAGLSASRATTTRQDAMAEPAAIVATDLRLGAMVGRTFGVVSPYVLARGFAGPVSWSLGGTDVKGSDTHKYQLGIGASVALGADLAILIDVAALGERSASLGMSYRL